MSTKMKPRKVGQSAKKKSLYSDNEASREAVMGRHRKSGGKSKQSASVQQQGTKAQGAHAETTAFFICHDCLSKALQGNVEKSPRPGHLRLALCTNRVWLAIEELGGVQMAAERLGYPPEEIDRWIDEHHIPYGPGEKVSWLSSYTIRELQMPPVWVEGDGWYWPQSGYLASRAEESDGLLKRPYSFPAHGLTDADEVRSTPLPGPQEASDAKPMSPEQLRIEEALERSGLFSSNKSSEFEVDNDDLKDWVWTMNLRTPKIQAGECMTGGMTEGCDWYRS